MADSVEIQYVLLIVIVVDEYVLLIVIAVYCWLMKICHVVAA